jgi:secreted trypsin-like serine protease
LRERHGIFLALILSSCSQPHSSPFRAAVTHGAPDPDDPAIVALVLQPALCGAPEIVSCTGTLVAPRAVLTAAHCLTEGPAGAIQVFFGEDARSDGVRLDVSGTYPHPDPSVDLALLVLASASPVAPLAVRTQILDAPAVGTTVRVVGFGADELQVVGLKRQGPAAIDQVDPATFRIRAAPALSCSGDSGGPVLLADAGVEQLAGVTSFGDAQCAISGTNVRVDAQASWLQATLATIAQLAPAPAREAIDPAGDFCSRACTVDADCPEGMLCTDGQDGLRCTLLGLPAARFGPPCLADDSCGGEVCATLPDGCRCLQPCSTRPPMGGGGCSVTRF